MATPNAGNLSGQSALLKKLGWTILLLAAYRIGVHVPVPGVNTAALSEFFSKAAGLIDMLNMLSGGGLLKFSVFTLGIIPYISASIILQLLQVVSPSIKRLAREEGATGRRKITQYTRYLTVLIAAVQAFFAASGLQSMAPGNIPVVTEPGLSFVLVTVVTITAGTIIVMWMGEQITERGIGNGISLIIFSGIVASLPASTYNLIARTVRGEVGVVSFLVVVAVIILVIAFIIFMERAQRRIPVHYAKRQVGRKMFGGHTNHLPLRINMAGVIPAIFASSLLSFPAMLAGFSTNTTVQGIAAYFQPTSFLFNVLYVAFIMFFCFFYTAIVSDPKEMAENLKKAGGFVPGIRPGEKTQEYLDKVITRLTVWGALYIAGVCVIPSFITSSFVGNLFFGGTSLLILVGVAIDFRSQIESHLISNQYDSLMQKNKMKNR